MHVQRRKALRAAVREAGCRRWCHLSVQELGTGYIKLVKMYQAVYSWCASFPKFICAKDSINIQFVSPRTHVLKNKPSCDIWRQGHWEGTEISALIKVTPEGSCTPSSTARRWPSMSQDTGAHQTPNLLTLWSWTSSLPNHEKKSFCHLNHPVSVTGTPKD